jgi:hypothetical protein
MGYWTGGRGWPGKEPRRRNTKKGGEWNHPLAARPLLSSGRTSNRRQQREQRIKASDAAFYLCFLCFLLFFLFGFEI